MTKLYVSEFPGLAATAQADSVPDFDATSLIQEQVVDYTSGVASKQLSQTTQWIEFEADSICSFLISSNDMAAAVTNMRMAAGERLRRRVSPGWWISAITNT